MSNTKQVHIEARVPYNWHEQEMTKSLLAYTASPVSGIDIEYKPSGSIPQENGGILSMFDVTIDGAEAYRLAFWGRIIMEILHGQGHVFKVYLYDLDNQAVLLNTKDGQKIAQQAKLWIDKNY